MKPSATRILLLACTTLPWIGSNAVVLTNDLTVGTADTNYDGLAIVISNCTVTVDGQHSFDSLTVGAGGTLTHSFFPDGLVPIINPILNEPHTLTGTNAVTLAVSNIVSGTVVVTDNLGAATYTNAVDYQLATVSGGLTTLNRTTNSAVPDGGMVLVSYEVVTGTVAGGLNLIVTNDVVVEAGGMINADGRGYGGNQGIGNGGEAGSPQSGGGGALGGDGGRIAIYSPANTFTGMVSVAGGPGFASGSTGTVHTAATLPSFGILSHSPSGAVSNTVHSVDLFFNAALDANSVSSDDFQVVTPYGMLSATSLAVSIPGLSQVRVSFADQNALGTYQLVVGTNITDLFGQPLSLAYVGAFNVALDTVSGMVTDTNGLPVAGVVLQPNGGLTAVFTEMDGGYALGLPSGWTGTVTPHLDGFMFVPQSRSYTNFNGALTGHNYTIVNTIGPLMSVAIVETNLLASWHGMAGVTYQPQCSTNLVDWEPYGPLLHGSNTLSGFTVPLDPDPRKFFKVEAGN